jgi:mono/diheme cytochrome c family protein
MRFAYTTSWMALLAAMAVPATAADPAQGEKLHREHCAGCHASMSGGDADALYTRSDRRVTTLEGLRKQVQRCELSRGLKWFDEDVANVTAYLNDKFYHFTP